MTKQLTITHLYDNGNGKDTVQRTALLTVNTEPTAQQVAAYVRNDLRIADEDVIDAAVTVTQDGKGWGWTAVVDYEDCTAYPFGTVA